MFWWLKPGWPRSARFLAISWRVTPSEIHSQTCSRIVGGRWATLPRGSRLVAGLRQSTGALTILDLRLTQSSSGLGGADGLVEPLVFGLRPSFFNMSFFMLIRVSFSTRRRKRLSRLTRLNPTSKLSHLHSLASVPLPPFVGLEK